MALFQDDVAFILSVWTNFFVGAQCCGHADKCANIIAGQLVLAAHRAIRSDRQLHQGLGQTPRVSATCARRVLHVCVIRVHRCWSESLAAEHLKSLLQASQRS